MAAIDSHCHVFDPARFAFAADTRYRPPPQECGNAADLVRVHDANGISHSLLVNPSSGYGYDNRYLLAAIDESHGRFKGIARVAPDADAQTLGALAGAGVIGIRLDLVGDGVDVLRHPAIPRLFAQVRELQWQIHVQSETGQLVDAAAVLRTAGVPLVFDHCGRPAPEAGVGQSGFQALLAFGREGHAVKLSGPFRFSREASPYADADPYVSKLIETFTPRRCVWGSDWPFLRIEKGKDADYAAVLALATRWLPDADARRQVMWDTPARLFGFAAPADAKDGA